MNKTYTPVEEIKFTNIPLTGVLVPGVTVGYVAESQYIKGGYIVVQTVEERDGLLNSSVYEDRDILTNGTPVYVAQDNITYRWDSTNRDWKTDDADLQALTIQLNALQNGLISANHNIDDLQKIALNQKTEIDQKVNATEFAEIVLDINSRKADKTEIPTSLSQLSNEETKFITVETDNLTNYTSTAAMEEKLAQKADLSVVQDLQSQVEASEADVVWDSPAPTDVAVGGMPAGTYLQGKSLKDIIAMMVYSKKLIYPTFTEPSLSIELDDVIGIANQTITARGILHFDRGAILLNEEFQNSRAGKADHYKLGDGLPMYITVVDDTQVEDVKFAYEIPSLPEGVNNIPLELFYREGPQPYDSFGYPYGEPYPAGSVKSQVKVMGLTNTFTGNSNDIDNVTLNNIEGGIITDSSEETKDLVGMFEEKDEEGCITGAGYQVTTTASTANEDWTEYYNPVVLIPASFELTGIKAWSTLHNAWEWFRGSTAEETIAANSFIKGELVTKEINNQPIEYYVYTYNDVALKPLQFRFYIA